MIPPGEALGELLAALALGAVLGLFWGFLRPLGKRRRNLADGLFLPGLALGLCVLGFGVCGGDLRPACLGAAALGGIGEEMTLGRLLAPVFYGFWFILSRFRRVVLTFWKKFFKSAKNVFASAGKWVTIGRKNRSESKSSPGGSTND